jgi:hypothetical protein
MQIWTFCVAGRPGGFCVIIRLTCSGGIPFGRMVWAKIRSASDGGRVVPLAGVGDRAGVVTR